LCRFAPEAIGAVGLRNDRGLFNSDTLAVVELQDDACWTSNACEALDDPDVDAIVADDDDRLSGRGIWHDSRTVCATTVRCEGYVAS
jgi:hypothetical protein